MKVAGKGELSGDSWRLYDYIVRHFLATVSYISVVVFVVIVIHPWRCVIGQLLRYATLDYGRLPLYTNDLHG